MSINAPDLFHAAGAVQMQVARMIQVTLLNSSNANYSEVKDIRGRIEELVCSLHVKGHCVQQQEFADATTMMAAANWMLDHYTKEFFKPETFNIGLVGGDSGGELPDSGYRFETPHAKSILGGIFEKAKDTALVEVVFHTDCVANPLVDYLSPGQMSYLSNIRRVSLKFQTYPGDDTKTQMDEYWVLGEKGRLMGRLYR